MRWSIIFVLFTFSCQIWGVCKQYTGVCQADWMAELPILIKQRFLNQLRLMGTHDSAAYQVDFGASIPMENSKILNYNREKLWSDRLYQKLLKEITLTQSLNVYQQLEQGIRAFDFRIFYHPQLQDFFMSHSFATIPMDSALLQIREFLNEHPGEIIIIQMQFDKEHFQLSIPYQNLAINRLKYVLEKLLIPNGDKRSVQSYIESKKRILFSFVDAVNLQDNLVWPSDSIWTYWPNQQTPQDSLANITQAVSGMSSDSFLNLVFFTVTPTQDLVMKTLVYSVFSCKWYGSLLDMAHQMNQAARLLIAAFAPGLKKLNIVSVDDPSDAYVGQIIEINRL